MERDLEAWGRKVGRERERERERSGEPLQVLLLVGVQWLIISVPEVAGADGDGGYGLSPHEVAVSSRSSNHRLNRHIDPPRLALWGRGKSLYIDLPRLNRVKF